MGERWKSYEHHMKPNRFVNEISFMDDEDTLAEHNMHVIDWHWKKSSQEEQHKKQIAAVWMQAFRGH